jgi:hypothetical protein
MPPQFELPTCDCYNPDMNEICEKFILTNALDEHQVRQGKLSACEVRQVEVMGIIDAQAVRSTSPFEIVQKLGVGIRGKLS